MIPKICLPPFLKNNFRRLKCLQQLIRVFMVALCHKKFTSRDIQKGNTVYFLSKMNACQKIIAVVLQQFIMRGQPRCHHFGYTPLYNSFGHFGIFQLVTDGHPKTSLYQFMQIIVKRMVGEPRQFKG